MKIFKVRITLRRIIAKMVALLIEAGESINAILVRKQRQIFMVMSQIN